MGSVNELLSKPAIELGQLHVNQGSDSTLHHLRTHHEDRKEGPDEDGCNQAHRQQEDDEIKDLGKVVHVILRFLLVHMYLLTRMHASTHACT